MFAAMKTRTKVLVGFGLAIAVAVIVGAVGYIGINKLSSHVEELGAVRLPSVQALLDIKVGAEQIKTIQRTLSNLGVDGATRQRQEANVATARERYGVAWKAYEALPQTAEEAQLWKQFVPAWEQWRSDNNEFFRLSHDVDDMMAKCAGSKNDDFNLLNALEGCVGQSIAVDDAFQTQIHEWKDVLVAWQEQRGLRKALCRIPAMRVGRASRPATAATDDSQHRVGSAGGGGGGESPR